MAFPFIFIVVSLSAGILLSSFLSFPLQGFIFGLTIGVSCAWIFFILRKNTLSFISILLATVFLGSSLYSVFNSEYEKNSLYRLDHASYADFYGKLYKSPSRGQDRDYLFIEVTKVLYQNREEKVSGNLRIGVLRSSQTGSHLNLFTGDKIKISAQLLPSRDFRNFKEPPLKRYLKTQNIHNRAFSKSPLLVEKLEAGKKYSLLHLISVLRQKLQQKIETHFPSPEKKSISSEGAVLEALLLGERGRMDDSINLALQKSGLFHLIAISGAHIVIISFLLFSLLKVLNVPSRLSYLLLMIFLVFYAFLVEGRASVLRATIMALAFFLGKLIWRDVNLINTISMSAFILLIINPFNLFDMGFELTFASTLSIILFYSKVIKYLPKLPLKISEMFALSLTAQLGVLPFMASTFNRVSFSSLILNYLAVPLVGLIMASGYIFFPLSFVSAFLANLLAQGLSLSIKLFISSSHLLDHFSFASYRIPPPHPLTIIGYFLFLLLTLLPLKVKKQRFIFLLFFGLFFAVLISYPFSSTSKSLKLTFIDVGEGDSILVEFPGHKKMLVDGGGFPSGTFDIGESVVSPFLWRKGIKKIDYLVLTHAHPDHLYGLNAIARNFKIGEFWEAFSPLESEAYAELKKSLSRTVLRKRLFRSFLHQEGEVRIEALYPWETNPYVESVHNDQSLVLRLSYGQTSFLLPGDIGVEAERQILENAGEIKSQVLKSAHHGSNTSSSKAFLERVSPQVVVISVGKGNVYGFPNQEILELYKEMGAKIFRTDHLGAVEISSDGQRISARTAGDDPPLD